MKCIALFFITLLLSGCSSGLDILIPDHLITSTKEKGYLTGTLGVTTAWPTTGEGLITTLYFRQRHSHDIITLTRTKSDPDFQTDIQQGQLFSIPLPPGDYELFSVGFTGNNGIQTVRSSSGDDLGIVLSVNSNEVTYIGQFITSSLVAKSPLWNTEYPSGFGVIRHSYANERDKQLFDEHYPELQALSFVSAQLNDANTKRLISKVIK
ncbi:hypothetical protein [Photobacterium nomapromontoriensis]|uniref:hypothetical protein n=1 Tax=Photobacterium nomapromontoriensis TaxID=2910237 RepID=UPI003D0C3CE4